MNLAPPGRYDHTLTYDAARRVGVLFGGAAFDTLFGDTWHFDGQSWTEILPATSPPHRSQHAMVYDPIRERSVMYGGSLHVYTDGTETWEYDGTDWTEVIPTASPSRRTGHSMAFDVARGRVLLLGGSTDSHTWEYYGNRWARVTTAPSSLFSGGQLVHDSSRGRTVDRRRQRMRQPRTRGNWTVRPGNR
ncbi:MAG: hypothetical protein IPK26_20235 [Planctomycetes bacterium]|nr:hypothetical protein [Planctomycetota bacterium]